MQKIIWQTIVLIMVAGELLMADDKAAVLPDVGVVGLRCEYLDNPLGIDAARPRLSWVIESTERGQRQRAYQVLVASNEEKLRADRGDLWDTGKVRSEQSIQVGYAGKKLGSRIGCYWKVRVWDKDGKASDWSEPAMWSMGLLQAGDWQGKWIGLDEDGKQEKYVAIPEKAQWIWYPEGNPTKTAPGNVKRYFRRVFEIEAGKRIKRAVLGVGADNSYVAYVNGHKVGEGSNIKCLRCYEVTELLKEGSNVLSASVMNAGNEENPAGLIMTLRMEFAEGEAEEINSDKQWKATQEENEGWTKREFEESGWVEALELGEYGIEPWKTLEIDKPRELSARMMRQEFKLKQQSIRRATAYISGLGYGELYMNGQKVGDHVLDPGLTDYDKRVFYVTYDVTEQMKEGDNAVGVILGNGRYYAPRENEPTVTKTYGFPKALVQIEVEYEDGKRQVVASNAEWKLTTEGPIRVNNDYDGEEYDAQREQPGWCEAGFDAKDWQKAQLVGAPAGKLKAQMAAPIKVTQTILPVVMTNPQPGVYVYDLGQNIVGWCRLRIKGGEKERGRRVVLRHAETLDKEGMLYVDNLRGAKATDVYVIKGQDEEVYEPRFTYHGFRYVELKGYPGEPDLETVMGRLVCSDFKEVGSFECSNELLNRIYQCVRWGMLDNYRSIPTDCPQRDERQGWLGDRAVGSKGESFIFDVAAFYHKWLDDIEDSQDNKGNVPDVAPAYWPIYNGDVTWPSTFLIIPDWFYDQYADKDMLARHYTGMKKWIKFMEQYVKEGLINKDAYGDWCVPPESPQLIHSKDPNRTTDKELLATAYFYHDLRLLGRFGEILGKGKEAKKFNKRAEEIKEAFNRKFFHEQESQYSNGTQTSSVLPLYFGLVPEGHRQGVFEKLVENINVKNKGHIATGLIGGQWLMRTLTDNGRADVAYQLAVNKTYPSWGYMVENGATTIWELWNGNTADPAMNSHNHLMLVGDMQLWLFESLAGIKSDPERPGFKHIIMRPEMVGDLKYVRASYESGYGRIESEWHRDVDKFRWQITVPANTTATVYVPAANAAEVKESDIPVRKAKGVKFLRMEAGRVVLEVASGKYSFTNE